MDVRLSGSNKRVSEKVLIMNYSINPEEHELKKAREKIEEVLESYSYAFEVENIEIDLGWQRIERDVSLLSSIDNTVILVLRPGSKLEGLEKNVLRGVFEIEYRQKAVYDSIEFDWQEIAKFAYVKNKIRKVLGNMEKGNRREELRQKWPELRQELEKEKEEFHEELYMNAAALGEIIGRELLEDKELDELPKLTKSDIIETGEKLFD